MKIYIFTDEDENPNVAVRASSESKAWIKFKKYMKIGKREEVDDVFSCSSVKLI